MGIYLLEHASPGYQGRTKFNADNADLTLAFTVDEHTAGEHSTRKLATEAKYGRIDLNTTTATCAARNISYLIGVKCREKPCEIINIAGNGIYTMAKHGWTQDQTNQYLYDVFVEMRDKWGCMPTKGFRSGGQTGVDIAGAVAASVIGIDAVITFPKGFRQRGIDKVDFTQTKDAVMQDIISMAGCVKSIREV